MLALVVDTSAHPRAMCYKCYNESMDQTLAERLTVAAQGSLKVSGK